MGMFSEVVNQCQALGEDFLGVLQTKDFECLMDLYWLAPDGTLYQVDDSGTWTLEFDEDAPVSLTSFKRVPTGLRGRLKPYRKFGTARFTARTNSGDYLEAVVWFEDGALQRVLCRGPIFSCERVDREGSSP